MIEYWEVDSHQFPEDAVSFKYKMETDLFALAKAKTRAGSLSVSPDGTQFAVFCADRCGNLFIFYKVEVVKSLQIRLQRGGWRGSFT